MEFNSYQIEITGYNSIELTIDYDETITIVKNNLREALDRANEIILEREGEE